MTTIKFVNIAPEHVSGLFTQDAGTETLKFTHTVTHILNITDSVLEYKLSRAKKGDEVSDVVLYNIKLNLDTLKSHNRFFDQSLWTIDLSRNTFMLPHEGAQTEIIVSELGSIYSNSYPTKQKPLVDPVTDSDYMMPIRIFVPSVNSTFNDCTIFVGKFIDGIFSNGTLQPAENSFYDITTNIMLNGAEITADMTDLRASLATITATTTSTTVAPGDLIPVTVTCSDPSVTKLYLEQVVGLLDRTQVDLSSGTGTFNIITNTLVSGNTAKVKIGYKLYTNVTAFTKTIA
jgi:hypothetical protein